MTDPKPKLNPILEALLTRQEAYLEEDDNNPQEGGETELLCSCGGPLVKYEPVRQRIQESIAAVGKQRYASTKRLQKKHHKQWVEKHHQTLMMGLIVGAIGPPQFRCKSCRRIIGFYETVARNIFRVEPLPPGALPIFTKEP